MLVSHDKYQGYCVLTQKVYDFVLGYMSRNAELETQVFFRKVPWDIYCNMDGIYFRLRTIAYSEVYIGNNNICS